MSRSGGTPLRHKLRTPLELAMLCIAVRPGASGNAWTIQPRKLQPVSNAITAADAVAVSHPVFLDATSTRIGNSCDKYLNRLSSCLRLL